MTRTTRLWTVLAGMALLLTGCDLSAIMPTPAQFPTLTSLPSDIPSSTPIPTDTPTATPTRVTPAALGTGLPPSKALAGGSPGELTLLAEWGSGLAQQVAWSPDGAWLGVAASRGVQVYHADTLELATLLLKGQLVRSLVFSPDGARLAAGLDEGVAAVYSLPEGRLVWRARLAAKPLLSLAFSPAGDLLAAGAVDGEVSVWQAGNGEPHQALGRHSGAAQRVAFIRDGAALLSWSQREQPYIWRLQDGKRLDDFYIGANPGGGSAAGLSVSADGALVAAAQGERVRLMRAGDNTTLATIGGFASPVLAQAVSDDGSVIAAAVAGEVQVWSSQPAALLARFPLDVPGDSVHLAVSPDGAQVVVLGDHLQLWTIAEGQALDQTATVYATDFHLAGFLDPVVGNWWNGASDGSLSARDLQTGAPLAGVIPLGIRPAAIVYAPGGGWAALAQGNKIQVWQAQPGEAAALRYTLSGHRLTVTSLAISADERWLASGSTDGTARLWDLASGEAGALLEIGDAVGWVQFSPDGGWLAACAHQRIRLWEVDGGAPVDEFDGYALAFQSGGDVLAVAGFEQGEPVVWLRQVGKAASLASLPVDAYRLAFAPAGDQLLAAGDTLSLFTVPGGQLVSQVALDTPLRAAVFLPGGERVLGAAWDGVLTVYEVP
ncbi:MAG: hypothetical protein HPY76_09865 [Anaerolineae bacterium]|nr:hypothetical protein [Anaerolineae bacterium]